MKIKNLSLTTLIFAFANIQLNAQSVVGNLGNSQDYTISICSDGSLLSCGDNYFGQLGDGTNTSNNTATAIAGITGVKKVVACSTSVCALKMDGTIMTWGKNDDGQLGDGTNTDSNVPVSVSSLSGITTIARGLYNFFALKNDSTVWSWGRNDNGQLGNGTISPTNIPLQVTGLTGVKSLRGPGAGNHALALKGNGTVWAWGENSFGQLGNGTVISSSVPVQVTGLTGIIAIGGNGLFSMALKNDGTVWAWGDNSFGQLGNGTFVNSNVPVQVTGLTGITAIDDIETYNFTYYTAHAIKNDGTVWGWGGNNYGQLGNGTFVNSNVPVQAIGLTGITALSGGYLALKGDGTVWSWGFNYYGQLGNGNNTDTNIPAQIASLSNITSITGVGYYSFAVAYDGTAHSWGSNSVGELGDGTNIDRNVPVLMNNQCPTPTCIAYYTTAYDTTLNNFTLTVDPASSAVAIGYEWNFGDGSPTSATPNPSHIFAVDSVYNVCMKIFTALGDSCAYCHSIGIDPAGNIVRSTGGFTMNVINGGITTDISQTTFDPITIYPNPSTGIFTINADQIETIEIYNVLGKIIYSSTENKSKTEIDISNAPKGVYFVKMLTGIKTYNQKIIIQ